MSKDSAFLFTSLNSQHYHNSLAKFRRNLFVKVGFLNHIVGFMQDWELKIMTELWISSKNILLK